MNKSVCEMHWLKDFTHTYQECRNVLLSTDDVLFPNKSFQMCGCFVICFAFSSRSKLPPMLKHRNSFLTKRKKKKNNHSEFEIHLFLKNQHWGFSWNKRSKIRLLNCRGPRRSCLSICSKKICFQHNSLLSLRKIITEFLTLKELIPFLPLGSWGNTHHESAERLWWFLNCCFSQTE